MEKQQYFAFLDSLPLPALIAKQMPEDELNQSVEFLNQAFINELGYTTKDIPDKNRWWEKAYPDLSYQKVVANQWELELELATERGSQVISMDVFITNKKNQEKRYRVITAPSPIGADFAQVYFIYLE
ncbi:hypothetical protein P2G88_09045 [Aliiglaciecola sp. CAU 1673]|uniref:hypothetical protein n=1 Tax=Aliiglaciecola sp. CAU 1673 TaxID=3032595 RepID=UPI0023DBA057|nr:hypothetical protein [Aliiglaciecola sp. CAU 1673]MDF2178397.1 hypothetical protein [Aliiglaciecola sp. CAU 1673]